MKSILAALLLGCAATLFGAVVEDETFDELFTAARFLNQQMSEWNKQCGQIPDEPSCSVQRLRIELMTNIWLSKAENFKAAGDPKDCDTSIRQRLIDIHRKIFVWNRNYIHRNGSAEAAEREMDSIMAEEKQLKEDIEHCDRTDNPAKGSPSPAAIRI